MSKFYGNIIEDDTIELAFNTFNYLGDSITVTDLASTDVEVYKDGIILSDPDAGVSLSLNVGAGDGSHLVIIDTSADAEYTVGSNYEVRLVGITVDTQTINAFIGSFSIDNRAADITKISGDATAANNLELQYDETGLSGETFPATQLQIDNRSVASAAVSTPAIAFTINDTKGTVNSGTYESTIQLDEVYHIVAVDGNNDLDITYTFNVGGNGVPVEIKWTGYAQSKNDIFKIWAWNYITEAYEQRGIINKAEDGIKIKTNSFDLLVTHVGTGANAGEVKFRITTEDATLFATDQLFCAYAVVFQSVGYANGCIWVNTNGSNTNTNNYVDGVADNPVSTWVAALTLSTSLGIKKFCIINGSSIALTDSIANFTITGAEWSLALAGKDISNAHIEEADVTGIGTTPSGKAHFDHCFIGDVTLGETNFTSCGLRGTFTQGVAGTYILDSCFAADTGGAGVPPEIDFVGGLGVSLFRLSDYNGGIKVTNLETGDKFSMQGTGHLTIDSTCSDGTIGANGCIYITDNVVGGFVAGGSGTLTEDARYSEDQIDDVILANADVSAIMTQTDKLNNMITEDSGGNIYTTEAMQNAPTAEMSDTELHDGLDSYTNKADYKAEVTDIQTQTDKLNNMITEDSAGNEFTTLALANAPTAEMDPTELANAMKAITGLTEGGTWTWEKIMKITTAMMGGDWQLNAAGTKQELLDAEDGTTVILEQELTRSPSASGKYRDITVKI